MSIQDKIITKKNNKKHTVVFIYLFLTAFITIALVPAFVMAEKITQVELEVKLLLTALTYDKNLKKNIPEQLTIGLLYFSGKQSSEDQANDFAMALEKFEAIKVKGLEFKTVIFDYGDSEKFREKVVSANINVLYIASGTRDVISDVTKMTKSVKIFTYSSSVDYVIDCGVSMAIGFKKNRPKIYLNMSSAKAEGRDFSAKFLRIVELVDRKKQ